MVKVHVGVIPRKRQSGKWQARIYVPVHLRPLLSSGKAINKDVSGKTREEALINAEKWADTVRSDWESRFGHIDTPPPSRTPRRNTAPAIDRSPQAKLNELVREAFAAQDTFDNFDCDTVNRPGDLIKLRQMTAEWDAANLQLVRYVLRNGEALVRELGGRVSRIDREAVTP